MPAHNLKHTNLQLLLLNVPRRGAYDIRSGGMLHWTRCYLPSFRVVPPVSGYIAPPPQIPSTQNFRVNEKGQFKTHRDKSTTSKIVASATTKSEQPSKGFIAAAENKVGRNRAAAKAYIIARTAKDISSSKCTTHGPMKNKSAWISTSSRENLAY